MVTSCPSQEQLIISLDMPSLMIVGVALALALLRIGYVAAFIYRFIIAFQVQVQHLRNDARLTFPLLTGALVG